MILVFLARFINSTKTVFRRGISELDKRYSNLSNMPLSGTLPPELGNLTNLTVLHLGEGPNQLHGPLPLTLMKLEKLQVLQYYDTDICEPTDPDFQAWLNTIPELHRTSITCTEP